MSEETRDGGCAFPIESKSYVDDVVQPPVRLVRLPDVLSKRDYFVAHILSGCPEWVYALESESIADRVYALADALKQRGKQ